MNLSSSCRNTVMPANMSLVNRYGWTTSWTEICFLAQMPGLLAISMPLTQTTQMSISEYKKSKHLQPWPKRLRKSAGFFLSLWGKFENSAVTKISVCQLNTTSRWGTKQLEIFWFYFLLFSDESLPGGSLPCCGQGACVPHWPRELCRRELSSRQGHSCQTGRRVEVWWKVIHWLSRLVLSTGLTIQFCKSFVTKTATEGTKKKLDVMGFHSYQKILGWMTVVKGSR